MPDKSEQILGELETILLKQCDIVSVLLDFASAKERALLDDDIKELKAVLEDEEDAVFDFSSYESKRVKKVNEFLHSVGKKPEQLSLTQMLALMEDADKTQTIAEAGSRLNKLAKKLHNENERINKIISIKRDYVDVMLEAITGDNEPTAQNYDGTGAIVRHKMENGPGVVEFFA